MNVKIIEKLLETVNLSQEILNDLATRNDPGTTYNIIRFACL
jgi:hypothetical protein